MKRLTALQKIEDKSSIETTRVRLARDERRERDTTGRAYTDGYHNGKAAAYNDAHRIMKAELQHLRNLLQNGCLTQADFGDDLPY